VLEFHAGWQQEFDHQKSGNKPGDQMEIKEKQEFCESAMQAPGDG